MSQRVKRPNRSEDGSVPVKRRKRTAAEEEEAASLAAASAATAIAGGGNVAGAGGAPGVAWQPPRSNDLKSIYNRTTTEAPAELFRKDLISAMKLPDSEPLASDEYWVIVDQWKQEWERGVQVPVNPDSLPEPLVSIKPSSSCSFKSHTDFKLHKTKYIRITKDEHFKMEEHVLSHAPAKSEAACSYDLDECDVAWLKILNSERAASGLGPIYEEELERVIERLELCCWDKIQSILRNEEGLGIEYDENVICDVCRSPDSEEGNEMVFCDSCNICVHQACYGITRIPEGQWLCCTCNIGKRPECVLCPNKGGAMKCLRTGQKWAHVSCALWIPEVSIGCVEKMEPITKVSSIPQSRWALICVLCRERVGACIQCSVKTCKTAYHVTCAFKHGLEMRAIIEDENADDGVKLRSYCEKHSKSSKKEKSTCSGSEDDDCKRKKRKDMTSEEKNQARAIRLQEIEAEFFKHVSVKDISIHFNIDSDALMYVYNYWKLKRKAGFNKPLLPPKSEDIDVLSHKREQADVEKMKMFVQLRQDLERVRNLCYMVSRREKLSRTFFRMREQTFHKQAAVLDSSPSLPPSVIEAVIEANHGPSIYDRLYSHNEAEDHTNDFEAILERIAGKSSAHPGDESKVEVNGLFKDVKNNPYKKVYFNGSSKRRSVSIYGSSMSEPSSSDEKPKDNKENRLHTDTEEEKPSVSSPTKKKSTAPRKPNNVSKVVERKRRKKHSISKGNVDSSSEEDIKPSKEDWGQFSRSRLSQMDKELGESASDSDELMMPMTALPKDDNHRTTAQSISTIYSDTESSEDSGKNDDKSSNAATDTQSRVRTKAAFKEFSHKPSKGNNKSNHHADIKRKSKTEEAKKERDSKKKDYVPSDLIVPQRQAAKKATENLKTTTTSRAKEHPAAVEESTPPKLLEEKPKQKLKTKSGKEKDIKEKDVKETENKEKQIKEKEIKEKEPKEFMKEDETPKDKEQLRDVRDKKREKEKENKQTVELFDMDKDIEKCEPQELLYVPQRQAAKKAAEHIKSGLGKPVVPQTADAPPPQEPADKAKKEPETKKVETAKKPETKKEAAEPTKPAKIPESKRKSSTNSSSNSSSSSSSSSDSSSSSSSDSDEEPVVEKAPQQPRSESSKRSSAKDLPFLDKGARSAATSGSSSSSDSSPPSSPTKKASSSSPLPTSRPDSPSRAANELTKTKRSPDKKQPSATSKREEQQQQQPSRPIRGRGRAARGRPRTSNSGERLGDANVRSRDMSDGQRVGVEGEPRFAKGRRGKSTARDTVDEKETASGNKLLSPIRKTDKKLRDAKTAEIGTLEKEILERKADKEGAATKNKASMFERLFGTPEKKEIKSEKVEKAEKVKRDLTKVIDKPVKPAERPLIAPEKLTIPDKNNFADKSRTVPDKTNKILEKLKPVEERKSPQRTASSHEKPKPDDIKKTTSLPDLSDKIIKHLEKPTKTESLIKSPNKELKEQIDKKLEHKEDKKVTSKKPAGKSKSIDDIFANKLSNSETKENKIVDIKKPPTPKQSKTSDEITLADKIVDDHLQTHKAKDLFNRQSEVVQEAFIVAPDVTKTLLNDLEAEKKNSLKPAGITNQVLQSRSIFSPQPHVKDATDFLDLVNFDDIGISKDDDLMKGSLTWNFNTNNSIIREDTKEDSARETLNLVEKLRMGLSKKSGGGELDEPTTSEADHLLQFPHEQLTESKNKDAKETPSVELELKVQVTQIAPAKEFPRMNKDTQPDFNYLNHIAPNLPKEIVQQNQSLTDHTAPVQGDERWVPPSNSYANVQNAVPANYLDSVVPSMDANSVVPSIVPDSVVPSSMVPHYLEQYANNASDNHKKQLNLLPTQLEARLQEEVLKSHSPSVQDNRRISQTPLIDPSSMDCMNSPMPYGNIHPQAKWADCEVIPNRRSVSRSSSSSSSSTSSSSRRDEEESRIPDVRLTNHSTLDMAATSYLPAQVPPSYPPNPLDNFGGYAAPDGSCYSVSLFPPPNLNTQLPFAATGPAPMYHPPAFGAPFPAPPHSVAPMSTTKPSEESSVAYSSTCTAAFTSSQHNMEFTASMVDMPPSAVTSKPVGQQLDHLGEQLLPPAAVEPAVAPPALTPTTSVEEIIPSPAVSNTTPTANSALPSPSASLKSNSSAGKKSPSKPTRTSARVSSQMMNKSPAKSPGKSPRQETALKQSGPGRGRSDSKRGTGKTAVHRGAGAMRNRGRGRGRGRGNHHSDFDFVSAGTIHNKLVGTVYDLDFDDDISNDNMTDLKSMRERRKSLDIHERKFEPFSSTRDSPRSPKFSSPSQTSHKGRSYNTDLRELRPPTPIEDSRSKTDISLTSSNSDPPRSFPDVTPPLPGPVDMRTYNSNFDQQTYNEQNLLSAFASGTAETQVQEIDEDFEKELHTALAKKPVELPPPSSEASSNIKVSLSDSRNQLKVKIKGPIANYTSTVAPLPPLPPPVLDSCAPIIVNSVSNNAIMYSGSSGVAGVASGGGGGPSSLRRMRKKELLRQYWTQDMNMDDPTSNTGFTAPAVPPLNRTIITIPKAVASMTSIPTKEDYRDYRTDSDDFIDSKHHRKESKSRPMSRELRQLDLTDNDGHLERRRSIGALGGSSIFDSSNKRRGRPTRPSLQQQQQQQQQLQHPITPKLKIKIGNNTNSIVGALESPHDKRDRIRPPKKRLAATQNKYSVEDLKRENMKFRKMMFKDLKVKHKKKDKSEKKKKKKLLKSEVQIIANTGENPTKLIIRFGKKSDSDIEKRTSGESDDLKPDVGKDADKPPLLESDDKVPPVKLGPIKLKLSRCQEGSGYVMKPPVHNTEKEEERAVQPGQPPPADATPRIDSEPATSSSPPSLLDPAPPVLAVNKDCEVR